ncbi:MAG: type III-B CRISPR module-associated protein Cmr5 [Candidatus Lokiarchaeota archaeon]|nr:type III-B CRISPR module-associated protein Cmr5 [Candidatus Lokiarchaeota archaeon]
MLLLAKDWFKLTSGKATMKMNKRLSLILKNHLTQKEEKMSQSNTYKGIERGRAQFAYECVEKIINDGQFKHESEYKSYVTNVPMYIKTNGLGAALTFVNAKKTDDNKKKGYAYSKIYEHTFEYIQKFANHILKLKKEHKKHMVKSIISLDSPKYRALTIEILAFFNWLRKFADGLIEEEKTGIIEETAND